MWPGPGSSISRRCLALAALLVQVLAAAAADAPWKIPVARQQFEEGRKLQEQALYPLAIDQYQMSLAGEDHARTERALGECFAAVDQHLLAAIHFARYVARVPGDAEALNRLGCLQLKVNKLEEAADSFRRLSKLDPESAKTGLFGVELKLGEKQYAAHEYRKAADRFRAAEAVGGADLRARDGLAKSLRALIGQQLGRSSPAALDTAFELYDRGELLGLRPLVEKAYQVAGRPPKLEKRVKRILSDPRVK